MSGCEYFTSCRVWVYCWSHTPPLAPLENGSKLEELVRNIRVRKGLNVRAQCSVTTTCS